MSKANIGVFSENDTVFFIDYAENNTTKLIKQGKVIGFVMGAVKILLSNGSTIIRRYSIFPNYESARQDLNRIAKYQIEDIELNIASYQDSLKHWKNILEENK